MGGDGIGREVVDAAIEALEATGAGLEILRPPHGIDVPGGFPDDTRRVCDNADAILFGAAERASEPVLMYLRVHRNAYANIRPVTALFATNQAVDLVIVRELSEGLYLGLEGDLSELRDRWPEMRDWVGRPLPAVGKFAIRVVTPDATRRIGRYAAQLAAHRATRRGRPGRVTIVTKENVLAATDGLFRSICEEEARAADVTCDHLYIDETARRLAARPEQFDVIVTTNLFGDVISDVASEAVGGMPVAPSAGFGDGFAYFEPVHGSGPDIVGKGVANPIGAMLSSAMALYHLGFASESSRMVAAVQASVRSGVRTPDMGGSSTTRQVVAAVCSALEGKPR